MKVEGLGSRVARLHPEWYFLLGSYSPQSKVSFYHPVGYAVLSAGDPLTQFNHRVATHLGAESRLQLCLALVLFEAKGRKARSYQSEVNFLAAVAVA